MKVLWSLTNHHKTAQVQPAQPVAQPTPVVQQPVAPAQPPQPVAPAVAPQTAAPAPVQPNPQNIAAIKKGPEGKAMHQFLQKNWNSAMPGSKAQFDTWMSNPDSAKALDDIGWETLARQWPTLKKRYQDMAPEDPNAAIQPTPTGLEDAQKQTEEQKLDSLVEPDLSEIMQEFGESFHAELLQKPFLRDGVADAFMGNTKGNKKKWKAFFETYPQFLPPDMQHSGNVRETINEQLRNYSLTGQTPQVIEALHNVVNSQDPATRKIVLDWVTHMANARRKGEEMQQSNSLNNAIGDDGAQKMDVTNMEKEEARRQGQENNLPPDELAPLKNVYNTFMSSQQNLPVLQQLKELTRPATGTKKEKTTRNADDLVSEGVSRALMGWNGENEEGRWREFFGKYPNLLPQNTQDPRALDKNKSVALQQMNQLAANGNPELQKWVSDIAKSYILDAIAANIPFAATTRQMEFLTDKVYNHIQSQAQGALDQGKIPTYITLVQRAEQVRAKMDVSLSRFRQLLSGGKNVTFTEKTKEGDKRFIVHIKDDQGGKGRLVVTDPKGVERDMDAKTFYQLCRIIKPDDWIPTYLNNLAKKDPRALMKSSPNRDITPQMKANEEQIKPLLQQNAGKGGDRLAPYRQKVAELFSNALKSVGLTPEQAAAKLSERGGAVDPKLFDANAAMINRLVQGGQNGTEPPELSRAFAEKISNAIGVPFDSWYFESPEYDPFNRDDKTNINATSDVAFDSFGPYLLHLKRRQIQRSQQTDSQGNPSWKFHGLSPNWMDPNALFYFLSIMKPHTHTSRGEKPNERHKTKILYQLIPPESPISEKHDPVKILQNLDTFDKDQAALPVGDRFNEYDMWRGHEPTSGKQYHNLEGKPRRVWYDTMDPSKPRVKKNEPAGTPLMDELPKRRYPWQVKDWTGAPVPKGKRHYAPTGKVEPPIGASSNFDRFIKAMNQLNHLENMKKNLSKFASVSYIDKLADKIANEAIFAMTNGTMSF
jgi:hypothetical protein